MEAVLKRVVAHGWGLVHTELPSDGNRRVVYYLQV